MKIQITNTEKLRGALAAVNGAASTHTASVHDVAAQAVLAEAHLNALGIAKKDRSGAVRDYVSGERVSNAYSKKSWSGRAATRVRLTRWASPRKTAQARCEILSAVRRSATHTQKKVGVGARQRACGCSAVRQGGLSLRSSARQSVRRAGGRGHCSRRLSATAR